MMGGSAPSYSSASPLIVHIGYTLEDSFAQLIWNIPYANLEYKNCRGVSPRGYQQQQKFYPE